MPGKFTQTKGVAKFGPSAGTLVDYSAEVEAVDLVIARDEVNLGADLATGETSYEAGAKGSTLQISTRLALAATSLASELEDAVMSGDPLYFEITLEQGAVSATNPEYSGQIVVNEAHVGGTVGDKRAQSPTFSVKAGTLVRDPA